MVVAETRAQHFLLPVDIGTAIFQRYAVVACILAQLLGCAYIVGIEDVVEGHIAVVSHVGLLLAALLGGDDDHTIGSLRTVDGGSGGIAEHIDRLNVVGSNNRDVNSRNSIDHIVGRHGACAQRGSTAQGDGGRAVRVGGGRNHQSGNLSLKHLTWVGEHTAVQVFGLHGRDGRCYVLALHGTITDHHNLVEQLVVFLQCDALASRDGLWRESDVGDVQLGSALHIERITAIDVSHCSILCSSLNDAYSYERFALCIADDSRHTVLRHCNRTTYQEGRRKQCLGEASSK